MSFQNNIYSDNLFKMITFVIKKKCNQTDSDKLCNNNRRPTDESTHNFDIFVRSVVGSLEGAVSYSVFTINIYLQEATISLHR
jgi:hypothetical protein